MERMAGVGLKNGPRDPHITVLTAATLNVLRGTFAGPEAARREVGRWAEALARWARANVEEPRTDSPPELFAGAKKLSRQAAAIIRQHMDEPQAARDWRKLTKAIYRGLWQLVDGEDVFRCLRDRSQARRWLPTGEEWDSQQSAQWADAWLTCRLFLDGLPCPARRRPNAARRAEQCWGCGSTRPHQWRWPSPGEGGDVMEDGCGWCSACCEGHINESLPLLPFLRDPYARLRGIDGLDATLPGPVIPTRGRYSVCSLCGTGEAGSEHVVLFCPEATTAWEALLPVRCLQSDTLWWHIGPELPVQEQ